MSKDFLAINKFVESNYQKVLEEYVEIYLKHKISYFPSYTFCYRELLKDSEMGGWACDKLIECILRKSAIEMYKQMKELK